MDKKQFEYRNFRVSWSGLHKAWQFYVRMGGCQQVFRAPTKEQAKKDIDYLLSKRDSESGLNEPHKLSDELMICQIHNGVMLHQCAGSVDVAADGQPGMPLVALDHQEMLELIAWYCREEAIPNGDLIALAIQWVVAGVIDERTATVALRALMARSAAEAVDAALTGWVMPHEEYE